MGRQDLTELSPIGSPTTTACPGSLLKDPGVSVVRRDESDFGLLDSIYLGPGGAASLAPISPTLTTLFGDPGFPLVWNLAVDGTLLDLEVGEAAAAGDSVSLLQLSSVAVVEEAGLDVVSTELLNTPPVEFQNLTVPAVSTFAGSFAWPHENMGVSTESRTTVGNSREQFPDHEVSASAATVSSCDVGLTSGLHEIWSKPQTSVTTSDFLPNFGTPMEATGQPADALKSTPMKKRLRRDFIQYPSEYVIKGVTFTRELFAKAYMQQNMVKTTKLLFRALFKDEDLSSQTLSGRKGVESLDKTKLNAISTLAWWMDQDKSQGLSNPYAINPSEVSKLLHPAEEMKDVRRKAFVETRNELGRKRRNSEAQPSSAPVRSPVKQRRQTSSH